MHEGQIVNAAKWKTEEKKSHAKFNLSRVGGAGARDHAVLHLRWHWLVSTPIFIWAARKIRPSRSKCSTVTAVAEQPRKMQDLVAEPLEKRLQELRWYDRVETITRPGLALMTLQLLDKTPPKEVADQFYQARRNSVMRRANCRKGAIRPFVNDEYSDVSFALYSVEAPGIPLRKLTRVAEDLRQRFLHVRRQKVDVVGEQQEAHLR